MLTDITLQPELKELLLIVKGRYSGLYRTLANRILMLVSPNESDRIAVREMVLPTWLTLKKVDLTLLNSEEQQQLRDLMSECEQNNHALGAQIATLRARSSAEITIADRIDQLEQELATERESTQQALQTSQEWHERQKQEIIAEWKGKLTNLINSRKALIQQEITLLREILSHE